MHITLYGYVFFKFILTDQKFRILYQNLAYNFKLKIIYIYSACSRIYTGQLLNSLEVLELSTNYRYIACKQNNLFTILINTLSVTDKYIYNNYYECKDDKDTNVSLVKILHRSLHCLLLRL